MARTRATTGNSKPRVFDQVAEPVKAAVAGKKRATQKGTSAKANTSKPRSTKVSADKVTKPKAAPKKSSAATTKKAPAKKTAASKTDKKVAAAAAKHETKETEAEAKPHHEPTLADTIAGAALKVQGLLTGSSGKKAAGTAKIRGTDGRKKGKN